MAWGIFRDEGVRALYRGASAAVLRQLVYGGIGVGLYHPMRRLVIGDGDPKSAPLWKRLIAGASTGGIGQAGT
jgi:solute carrier family 25 (mitochondrial uncoupling protein), member 8/9